MGKVLLLLLSLTLPYWTFASEPISPVPQTGSSASADKLALGRRLFHDTRLSRNGTISCASCHSLKLGGADGREKSVGVDGAAGSLNAPSVFNSGLNFRHFWDGRAKKLEEQIDGPIQHPREMGASWPEVVKKLKSDANYPLSFRNVYADEIKVNHIKDAIAAYEKSLVTPNSRFDLFLNGNPGAISEREKSGYAKFKAYGCIACHQGVNVGGNMFQSMGVMGNYFKDRKKPIEDSDLGRYAVTKLESDKFVFRVPSLRNVALTAPYFHDGTAKTLEEAVATMGKYQLGLELSKEDVSLIAAFLRTLTGQLNPAAVP